MNQRRSVLLVALALSLVIGWFVSMNTTPSVAAKPRDTFSIFLPFVSVSQLPIIPATPPLPPLDWDPRLGTGDLVLPHLENVRIISATVASGQPFWRVVKVKFEDINESGNDHTIYVKVIDGNGNRVNGQRAHLTSVGGLSEYPEEKPAGDLCDCNFNYPMYGDGYNFDIDGDYPSDMMYGMIMPFRRHVNYRITFQFSISP